jgi:hypothetical protein
VLHMIWWVKRHPVGCQVVGLMKKSPLCVVKKNNTATSFLCYVVCVERDFLLSVCAFTVYYYCVLVPTRYLHYLHPTNKPSSTLSYTIR